MPYFTLLTVIVSLLAVPNIMLAKKGGKSALPDLPEPPPIAKHYKRTKPVLKTEKKPAAVRARGNYEEFRYMGRVYMIKITPKKGKSYYLIDEEGKGDFKRSDLEPSINPPSWILKKF